MKIKLLIRFESGLTESHQFDWTGDTYTFSRAAIGDGNSLADAYFKLMSVEDQTILRCGWYISSLDELIFTKPLSNI